MEKVRLLMPAPNERRAAVTVEAGGDRLRPREPNQVVYCTAYAAAGLIPPFSDFFLQILEVYGLQMLHLTPHAVMLLGIFAHFCEMFVGILPSVDLFRRHFIVRHTGTRTAGVPELAGCVKFSLRAGAEFPATTAKSKWEEWRQRWVYIGVDANDRLLLPVATASQQPSWTRMPAPDARLDPVFARITDIVGAGLTGPMVLADFTRRRLAPLQRRSRGAWLYTGPGDATRTRPEELPEGGVRAVVQSSLTLAAGEDCALPAGILPLCRHPDRVRIQGLLPSFDSVGVVERRSDLAIGAPTAAAGDDPLDGLELESEAEATSPP